MRELREIVDNQIQPVERENERKIDKETDRERQREIDRERY